MLQLQHAIMSKDWMALHTPIRAMLDFITPLFRLKSAHMQIMGDEASTAQVHPELLTKALIAAAGEKGSSVRHGIVDGISLNSDQAVTGAMHYVQTVVCIVWHCHPLQSG